jgi:hypothetical protein
MSNLRVIGGGGSKKKKEEEPRCTWCHSTVVHPGYSCPRIAAVEFYEDWEVSRVEFHDWAEYEPERQSPKEEEESPSTDQGTEESQP